MSNSIGRSLSLSYNGTKQLVSVADNAWPPRSVAYGYDAAGNLASFTDPVGNTTTFSYTPADGGFPKGLLSQIFYPSSPTTPFVTNAYDTLGRVAAQTNANGATWNYFFAGYRSEEDDPHGTQHVLYYNPRGKALFDIQDATGLDLKTRFTYDGLDRLTATVLPSGLATSYTYAAAPNPWANNVATVTRSAASGPLTPTVTSYAYEASFNKPARITDALGRVTLVEYDSWTGNPLAVTADFGAAPHFNVRTTATYNEIGLVVSTTDPVGVVTRHSYDGFGNRVSTVADAGTGRLNLATTFTYDARGDPLSVTDPRGNTVTSTYDAARRLVTTTAPATSGVPGGVRTTNAYDADSWLIQVQQSAGGSVLRTTSATYTLSGRQATTTDANGNVTRFAYDPLDRLASVTDAAGRVTTYAYDAISRRTATFNPAIQATALLAQTYTPNGKLATLSDANGNTTSFAYDGFDRLATTTYPGGSTEAFTYDALDNMLTRKTRAGPSAIITFAYDTLNRLTTKTPPSGPVVSYSYDRAGRRTGVSDTSAAVPSVATPVTTTTYATNYAYDVLNRPTSVAWDPVSSATPPAAGTLVTFGHSYNAVNQRVGQTVSDNTWLAYPAATPATTTYTANSLNQYTAVGGATPTYDGDGNLTNDGSHTYSYDPENRLLTATQGGNTATYQYDAQGRRKSRTVGGTTTIFVTDADNREMLEYDGGTGAVLRWYAYGLGPNDVLGQMNVPAGTRTMPIPDILGSIVGSVDSSTGAISKASYLAYGGSATPASPFAFTGQRFDPEAGLYYHRARHYSTAYGRFLQADPVGYEAGANLYAYVGNDPLNAIDPTGLAADYYGAGSGGGWNSGSDWGGGSTIAVGGAAPAVLPAPSPSGAGGFTTVANPGAQIAQAAPLNPYGPVRPGPTGGAFTLGDVLTPSGQPVGIVSRGATEEIRTVTGPDFAKIQTDLLVGSSPIPAPPGYEGTWHQRRDGSTIGIRLSDKSGVTIDVIQSQDPTIPPGFKVHRQ